MGKVDERIKKGELLINEGKYEDAIVYFENLRQEKPEDPVILNKLGIIYVYMKRFDDAERYFYKAIELDKTYPEPYNNIGNIYYEKKDYKRAIEYYKKAIDLNPNYAIAYRNMGAAYKRLGNLDKAVKYFKKATYHEVFSSGDGIFIRRMKGSSITEKDRWQKYLGFAIIGISLILFLLLKR
ncbi:MAG TPA: tetratricopeptide repeat protein, partial [Candidatus Atribacteria bacterium]|nr:tetratricopeptide repeat protein [Candidatus Atribacteria bacterium]